MTLFPGLNDSQAAALVETAQAIRTEPQWLWELVNFESRHNPTIVNRYPDPKTGIYTGAVGLIQIIPSTARAMGIISYDFPITTNADREKYIALYIQRYSNYEAQMRGPVRDYFTKLPASRGPFPTRQSLFMAVFRPVAREVSPNTVLPDSVRRVNPGIDTVGDYVNKVANVARSKTPAVAGGIAGVTVFAIIGTAAVFFSKGGRL